MKSNFIINFSFWIFRFFGGGGGGTKIAISQQVWGVGDCRSSILCGSLWENIVKSVGGREIV